MARDLYKGLSGDDVTWLQQALNSLGYYYGTIDGDFGNMTDASVKSFQTAYGLYVDGIVGPQTYAALTAIVGSSYDTSDAISGGINPINGDSTLRESGRWGNHRFVVSAELIRSFRDLQITSSSEMESSENSAQGYVSYKGSSPSEVNFTLELNASTGCDVRNEAITWANEAQNGIRNYFYVGGALLLDTLLLLTNVTISDIVLSPQGVWVSANVAITMKQCQATDVYVDNSSSSGSTGSGSSGGSGYTSSATGSKKASVNNTNSLLSVLNSKANVFTTGTAATTAAFNTGTSYYSPWSKTTTATTAGSYYNTWAKTTTSTASSARTNKTTTTKVTTGSSYKVIKKTK